jgi:hypothetical protein
MNSDRPSRSSEDIISRRRVLKRIGAGAAIAWSAPILTSIRTPAFAESPPSPHCDPRELCPIPDCDVIRPCQSGNCACFRNVDTNFCWCGDLKDGFCESFNPCETGADCASGEVCVATCCPTGICMPSCGSSSSRRFAGKGRKLTK